MRVGSRTEEPKTSKRNRKQRRRDSFPVQVREVRWGEAQRTGTSTGESSAEDFRGFYGRGTLNASTEVGDQEVHKIRFARGTNQGYRWTQCGHMRRFPTYLQRLNRDFRSGTPHSGRNGSRLCAAAIPTLTGKCKPMLRYNLAWIEQCSNAQRTSGGEQWRRGGGGREQESARVARLGSSQEPLYS